MTAHSGIEAQHGDADLCTACGLCCDGTLFSFVALAPAEIDDARVAGLSVMDRDGGTAFTQPCARLEGRRCGIYARRPAACRSYACVVLRKVWGGAIERPRAAEIVRTAIDLRTRRQREEARSGVAAPATKLAAFALNHYLAQHFIRKADPDRAPPSEGG